MADMAVLEEEAIKTITGEGAYTVELINRLMPIQREKLSKAHEEMTRLNEEMKQEVERRAEHIAEIEQIHTWADSFEAAAFDHKRTIIAGVVEKVVVANVKEIEVVLKLTARQFLGENSEGTGD